MNAGKGYYTKIKQSRGSEKKYFTCDISKEHCWPSNFYLSFCYIFIQRRKGHSNSEPSLSTTLLPHTTFCYFRIHSFIVLHFPVTSPLELAVCIEKFIRYHTTIFSKLKVSAFSCSVQKERR